MTRSIYRIYTRKPLMIEAPKHATESEKRVAELRVQDLAVLDKAGDMQPSEVAKSIRRLQMQSSEVASKYVAKFARSENDQIRSAAIELAASQKLSEFEPQIQSALKSPSKEIRLAALRGLGKSAGNFSRAEVSDHWSNNVADEKERLVTLLTLLKISVEPKEKENWQSLLIEELRKDRGKEHSEEWVEAFRSLPGHDSVLDIAWEIVGRAEADEVSFRALLYLRDFAKSKALKARLGSVNIPNHRRYQMALVDLMFDHCPIGWNELVKRIMTSNPHSVVKKGLSEAELSVKCL